MIRAFTSIIAVLLVSTSATLAQSPTERGSYLVNTLMTCHNCHTPIGPGGPQFDRALSGGLRFSEAVFDVTAANITPDPETGIGKWSADEIKKTLVTGVRPNGVALAPPMPTALGPLPEGANACRLLQRDSLAISRRNPKKGMLYLR
jgi:hypothetical protein